MCLELSDIEDAVLSKYDSDLLIDVDYLIIQTGISS